MTEEETNEARKENLLKQVEILRRRIETGEVKGFVLFTTRANGNCGFSLTGAVEPPSTITMMEHIKLVLLDDYLESFADTKGKPTLTVETGGDDA